MRSRFAAYRGESDPFRPAHENSASAGLLRRTSQPAADGLHGVDTDRMPGQEAGGTDDAADREVVRGVLGGRTDDFGILVERYRRYVFKIVSGIVPPETVQDLAHEAFVEAYRSLPKLEGKASFRKWLAGIAVHRCYDYWRGVYRNREVPVSSLGEEHRKWVEAAAAAQADGAFRRLETRKEAREILQWALSGLSAEERMVVALVHLEGLSAIEAADLLGWSIVKLKVRAHRTREKMRKRITALLAEVD